MALIWYTFVTAPISCGWFCGFVSCVSSCFGFWCCSLVSSLFILFACAPKNLNSHAKEGKRTHPRCCNLRVELKRKRKTSNSTLRSQLRKRNRFQNVHLAGHFKKNTGDDDDDDEVWCDGLVWFGMVVWSSGSSDSRCIGILTIEENNIIRKPKQKEGVDRVPGEVTKETERSVGDKGEHVC